MKLNTRKNRSLKKARGQGMTEYIIIVALIAIAAIGVITLFGDNVRQLFAASAQALAGNDTVSNQGQTAQQQEIIKRYTGELIVKVVETVSTAMANLAPASLAFGQSEAGFGVNRRRVTLRQLPGPHGTAPAPTASRTRATATRPA